MNELEPPVRVRRTWGQLVLIPAEHDCDRTYMARVRLVAMRRVTVKLHLIEESDAEGVYHDHPWDFVSVVIRRPYLEQRLVGNTILESVHRVRRTKRKVRHRVHLQRPGRSITLVLTWGIPQPWSFYDPAGALLPPVKNRLVTMPRSAWIKFALRRGRLPTPREARIALGEEAS